MAVNFSKWVLLGCVLPLHQLLTVTLDTPSLVASQFCLRPLTCKTSFNIISLTKIKVLLTEQSQRYSGKLKADAVGRSPNQDEAKLLLLKV
jgi:hypothetical protein